MATIETIKEQAQAQTPLVLFRLTFRDNTQRYFATHAVTYAGNNYEARVLRHNFFEMQAMSEQGTDQAPRLSLVLANADTQMSQLNAAKGFKGALLLATFIFMNLATGVASDDSWVAFSGLCNAPDEISDLEISLSAVNRLSLQRVALPPVRVQKRCPWAFPATADDRQNGADDRNSIFYQCGYSPDAAGGNARGNLNGAVPFTTCGRTRTDCEARGMFNTDSAARATRRFGGIEYAPPIIRVRPFGSRETITSPVIAARYNDPVPLVYGQSWVRPQVTALRGDGNLTRFEAALSFGEIADVLQVVVNGFVIPRGVTGRDMTGSGWYNLVNSGDREGDFDLTFGPAGASDPYGSIAYLSINVPTKAADGSSAPDVQVLVKGRLVETFDSAGTSLGWSWSDNPVWILLDILKMARWRTADMNLASAHNAAQYCAGTISQVDDFGVTAQAPRFRCHLAMEGRAGAAETVLGLRNNARIYFTYGSDGNLNFEIEQTIAGQQPSKPFGSNATVTLAGGWPSYVYSDATSTILRREDGSSTLRVFHRPISDTPTRVSFEFFNEHNQGSQDSLALVDVDEQRDVGQDVSAQIPILGVPNYSQALRQARWLLDKNIRGNRYIEFETSVKAVGQMLGQIIAVSYLKENWSNKLFRVLKIAPDRNYRKVAVTAQEHDDAWYSDSAENPPRRRAILPQLPERPPSPVKGTFGPPGTGPEPGTSSDYYRTRDSREMHIRVTGEEVKAGTDGTPLIRVGIILAGPPAAMSLKTTIPQADLQPTLSSTGGSLPGNHTLYYAVAAVDADGARTFSSWVITAAIPAGPNTNQVTLTGLKFDADAATTMVVYRGRTPQTMIGREVPRAATFTDDGTATDWGESPFDPFLDHINYYWRRVLNTRPPDATHPSPVTADIFSAFTIGSTVLAMAVNAHAGYVAEIVRGTLAGQRRVVASNTATTLTLAQNWEGAPDATSVFILHNRTTAASGTTITDSGASWTDDQWKGARVRITSGTGLYQERRILSHSASQITLDQAWEVAPDSASAFVISEDAWHFGAATGSLYSTPLATTPQGAFDVPNESGLVIEYTAAAADAEDREAVHELGVVARYAVAGFEQTPILRDATTAVLRKMRLVNGEIIWDAA